MIAAQFRISGAEEVAARLEAKTSEIHAAVLGSLKTWGTELAGYIKETKLSGNPLHRRSGDLSRSVVPYLRDEGSIVEGGAGAGAGIPYAKIQEYGGTIDHPGGTAYIVQKDGSILFVSNSNPMAWYLLRTRPHTINMPERSYMRSSFREQSAEGIAEMREAVKAAVLA